MRMNLKVPFAEKDQAKKLGARWDAARKIWYVDVADIAPFARWSPTAHDGAPGDVAPKAAPAARMQSAGKVFVGSAYTEAARVCECLPWDVCDKCRPTALNV